MLLSCGVCVRAVTMVECLIVDEVLICAVLVVCPVDFDDFIYGCPQYAVFLFDNVHLDVSLVVEYDLS